MDKIIIDDKLWSELRASAIRFIRDFALSGKQKIRLYPQLDDIALLWLYHQTDSNQDWYIFRMNQLGIILDTDEVYKKIADWNKRDGYGRAQPKEEAKMSDDILDGWTQYLHINRDLLDDPEIYAEDYIN